MIIIVPQRSETAKGGALQQYIEKHGRHFTAALADYVCGMMANADGTTHMWNTAEVAEAYRQTGRTDKGTLTDGDICYLANMAYADFYPSPLTSTSSCLEYAYRVATDPDGYNGLPFTRWLADMEAKGECLDFARFVE